MEKDVMMGITIGVLAFIALGFVYYINTYETLDFLADPLEGEGFGNLCSSPEDCSDFCQNNMGRCNNYCQFNPTNSLCNTLFGGVN